MATQNSRRIMNALRKYPESSSLPEVSIGLDRNGILAPHYKIDQKVYVISKCVTIVNPDKWEVARATVKRIIYDGRKFEYDVQYDDLYSRIIDSSDINKIIFQSEVRARNMADRMNESFRLNLDVIPTSL